MRALLVVFLILFSVAAAEAKPIECAPAGCSGEICAEKGVGIASACMWRESFACYKTAVCEPQRDANGKRACGWRQTPQLQQCLQNKASTGGPPPPIRNIQ